MLSGCIAKGRSVLAAEVLGADLAYIGSPFLASTEANTQDGFKRDDRERQCGGHHGDELLYRR